MRYVFTTLLVLSSWGYSQDMLSKFEIDVALNDLAALLEENFAYYEANDADYLTAIQELKDKASQGMDANNFKWEVQKILALSIDGHARVRGLEIPDELEAYLSFIVAPVVGERDIAIHRFGHEFFNEEYPFITHLDGMSIEEWLAKTSFFIPKGSQQLIQRRGLELLINLQFLRSQFSLILQEDINIKLSNDDAETIEFSVSLSKNDPKARELFRLRTQIFDSKIAYLRLKQMDAEAVELVRTWMPQFKNTEGLIIDVRGNGGGSREALLHLFPYFMPNDAEPRIVNIAKYRLAPEFEADHLDKRFMYVAEHSIWSEQEKSAIKAFSRDFSPEWQPDCEQFSDWHYLLISPKDENYYYDKPVVILTDAGAFSATDIFLSAFKGWPNVTIMGEASSGGSARSRSYSLEGVNVEIVLASMASFQSNGLLYDSNGIQPDIELEHQASDYLKNGTDSFLDAALEYLGQTP